MGTIRRGDAREGRRYKVLAFTALTLCRLLGHDWSDWASLDEHTYDAPGWYRWCRCCGTEQDATEVGQA